jgi:hypothetical protein
VEVISAISSGFISSKNGGQQQFSYPETVSSPLHTGQYIHPCIYQTDFQRPVFAEKRVALVDQDAVEPGLGILRPSQGMVRLQSLYDGIVNHVQRILSALDIGISNAIKPLLIIFYEQGKFLCGIHLFNPLAPDI